MIVKMTGMQQLVGAGAGAVLAFRHLRLHASSPRVMPGLVPGIHALLPEMQEGVHGRDKPGHDRDC
ncbi:hypothetical protein D4Q52_15325 [Rhodopseudomonas palustris]|uniref:Uncharacterized protein n=1 Tax=Rhodopseudomonas palustris TaxID=1076 RepID=A0A418V3N8_RHOPL|nr:hypothetical protein D4Q52_15325 [Rhodopseudomonas palustris]